MTAQASLTALTSVGHQGWQLDALKVTAPTALPTPTQWQVLIGGESRAVAVKADGPASAVATLANPVSWPTALRISDDTHVWTHADAQIVTEGADDFTPRVDQGVLLRERLSQATGRRPVILFLHGGAEAGTDNWAQLVGTFGATELARRFPDAHVIAPQAPPPHTPGPPPRLPFAQSDLDDTTGWHRDYLARIGSVLRTMVDNGLADPTRLYLTGVSMGGAGVLRMLSVEPTLFAAAAPVCPTMTPETFEILRNIHSTPLWVSTAYVDHTPDRHKYLTDGVLHLVRGGHPDAHLTLFSPEQMAAYGIAADPEAPLDAKLSDLHHSWILTYSNENGILDWLTNHVRRPPSRPERAPDHGETE